MFANTPETYNYERYKMSNYDAMAFDGPKAGEEALWGFELTDLDGKKIKLSDYKGKWVVIETGSLTCGMYVKNIEKKNGVAYLVEKFPDVEFLTVYVREAHPGSRQGPSFTLEEKIELAKRTKEEYNDPREFLVDSVDGDMHRAYGCWPNMAYVINPEGKVTYRCDSAFPHLMEKALTERDKVNTKEHESIITAPLQIMIPVVLRGGWDALWDIVIALPMLAFKHFQADVAAIMKRFSGEKKTTDS